MEQSKIGTMKNKTRVTLTHDELRILAWFMDHYTDYLSGDDRIDHGWNVLKLERERPMEWKTEIYTLAGKLIMSARNLKQSSQNVNKASQGGEDG